MDNLISSLSLSLLGGNFFEANLENEGSVSGSDSTFYRQSEGKVAYGFTPNGRLEDWKLLQIVRSLIALGPLMELCYCV